MISDIPETLSGSIIFVTGFWFFWWGWRPAGNPCYSWRTWQTSQGEATSGDYNLLFLLSGECIGGNKIDTCPWILAPLWQLVPIFQEGHSRAGKISEIESSKIFKINMVRTFLPVLSWVSFLPLPDFTSFGLQMEIGFVLLYTVTTSYVPGRYCPLLRELKGHLFF